MNDYTPTSGSASTQASELSNALSSQTQQNHSSSASPLLEVREWVAIIAIIGFLFLLTVIVIVGRYDSRSTHNVGTGSYLRPQKVDVYIQGAVKNPGIYRVKSGTLIKDAIILAEPLSDADLKKIRSQSKVRNGQNIKVPTREMISIWVSGAVQEDSELIVPKGARLGDLCKYIQFTDEADLKKMNSKRFLKENETVVVPVKGAKRQNRRRKAGELTFLKNNENSVLCKKQLFDILFI